MVKEHGVRLGDYRAKSSLEGGFYQDDSVTTMALHGDVFKKMYSPWCLE